MLFDILQRLGSRAQRLLMYPSEYNIEPASSSQKSELLKNAQDQYCAALQPVGVHKRANDDRLLSRRCSLCKPLN